MSDRSSTLHLVRSDHGAQAVSSWRLGLGLWGVYLIASMLMTASLGADSFLLLFSFVWVAHGLALTVLLHGAVGRINALGGWLRWLCLLLIVVVMAIIQTFLDHVVTSYVVYYAISVFDLEVRGGSLLFVDGVRTRNAGFPVTAMIYFWVFGCYALADSLLRFQKRLSDAEANAKRAELSALRLQLNPHFLFNVLAGVSTLIRSGRMEQADQATMKLAEFYRSMLLADFSRPTTLGGEIDMIQSYLEIEQMRFPDRLRVEFDVPADHENAGMPPFILQPLVENAIKHGVARVVSPVLVSIVAEPAPRGRLRIAVSENSRRADRSQPTKGAAIGLANVRERLLAFYGPEAALRVEDSDVGFSTIIEFPYREIGMDEETPPRGQVEA